MILAQIQSWGKNITDPQSVFQEIDANGEGEISFDEFANWCIVHALLAQDDLEDAAPPEPAAKSPSSLHSRAVFRAGFVKSAPVSTSATSPTDRKKKGTWSTANRLVGVGVGVKGETKPVRAPSPPKVKPTPPRVTGKSVGSTSPTAKTSAAKRSVSARRRGAQQSDNNARKLDGTPEIWQALANKLPTGQTAEEKLKRNELWKTFDPNGNGHLSLAEIDRGLMLVLGSGDVFKAKPVLLRAYSAAKNLSGTEKGVNGVTCTLFVSSCDAVAQAKLSSFSFL